MAEDLAKLRARIAELGKSLTQPFNTLEGVGGARIEQLISRQIVRDLDAAGDFIDSAPGGLGKIQLKGPLPLDKVNANVQIEDFLLSIRGAIRENTYMQTLVVDTLGFSPEVAYSIEQLVLAYCREFPNGARLKVIFMK